MTDLCALCLDTLAHGANLIRAHDPADGAPDGQRHIGWSEAITRVSAGKLVSINDRVTDCAARTTIRGTRVCAWCVQAALDPRGRLGVAGWR